MSNGKQTLKRLSERDEEITTTDKLKLRKLIGEEIEDDGPSKSHGSGANKTDLRSLIPALEHGLPQDVPRRNVEQRYLQAGDDLSFIQHVYPPDFCKFYIDTGKCFVQDGCKFLHEASNLKFGWRLAAEKADKTCGGDEDDVTSQESDDEWNGRDIPETCCLCREILGVAVRTKCGHFFCEDCYLSDVKSIQKCLLCFKEIDGPIKHITVTGPNADVAVQELT